MSEKPEIQVLFVKLNKDGTVEKTHHFAPWPTGAGVIPGSPNMGLVPVPPDDGERPPLRHLTYDDPPGIGLTPDEYREMLAEQVRQCGSLERFMETVTKILVKDLVLAHGCHLEDAIPAVMEFAAKVYAEVTGSV